MRLLVETDILFFIEGDFILTIEELGFRVIVKEVGSVSQLVQKVHHSETQPDEDTDSSQEVLGFEDIGDNVEPAADIGSQNQRTVIGLDDDVQGIKQLTPQKDSNFENRNEEPEYALPAESINSDTRTKTANFSTNACSVEVIKDYVKATTLGQEQNGAPECNNEESFQEPPGFERSVKPHQRVADIKDQMCNQECQPVGTINPSLVSAGVNQTDTIQSGRVLRSSTNKLSKEPVNQRTTSHSKRLIENSEDSIQQLAKEALDIGKILGITVVQHEQAAKEIITESLTKCKKPLTQTGKARSKKQGSAKN